MAEPGDVGRWNRILVLLAMLPVAYIVLTLLVVVPARGSVPQIVVSALAWTGLALIIGMLVFFHKQIGEDNGLTDDQRAEWRGAIWFGGPFGMIWYALHRFRRDEPPRPQDPAEDTWD